MRDIQYATGLLVDAGLVDPHRIGATGESYGGGVSLQLATLRDRVMFEDGSLHPWTSRNGTALSLAAAAPVIPWSDLVGSLLPTGARSTPRSRRPPPISRRSGSRSSPSSRDCSPAATYPMIAGRL